MSKAPPVPDRPTVLPLSDSACNRPVKNRCPWRTEAVSLALGRRQFRVGAQLLFRFLALGCLLLDHPAREDGASDFPHLLTEYAERLEVGSFASVLLLAPLADPFYVVLCPSRLLFDVFSCALSALLALHLSRIFCQRLPPLALSEVSAVITDE